MATPSQPIVDLVIPARNEHENICALIEALPTSFFRHVVVADNGSTDGTAGLARSEGVVVVSESQRGYGAACLAGLSWIDNQSERPEMVAFIDADLADDPAELPKLCGPITEGKADLVIGSRHRHAEPGSLTVTQRFGNRLACVLIGLFTGQRYHDLGPMRVVRWSSLERLKMSDRTWGWTVEMQYKAATEGLRVVEIDVPYRPRRAGVSKISGTVIGSIRAGYKILTTIAKLWWQTRSR